MIFKAKSTVVTPDISDLAVSSRHVARWAGGRRYRPDQAQQECVAEVLKKAAQLVDPAFVYSVHEVSKILEAFPMAAGEKDAGMTHLAFCVCTIGGRLEKTARTLMSTGASLEAFFLDAAGVAFLNALSTKAYDTLRKLAKERLLHYSCRFAPGYGGLDLSAQKHLFDLVDASMICVRLNEDCVMSPSKSLSFFTKWTTSKSSDASLRNCASCTLADCPYRV